MERKNNVANTDEVAVLEKLSTFDDLFVDESSVAAIEIFNGESRTIADHFAVIAADRTNIDYDIALRMPTEYRLGPIQFIPATSLRAIVCGEKGHPKAILGVNGRVAYVK